MCRPIYFFYNPQLHYPTHDFCGWKASISTLSCIKRAKWKIWSHCTRNYFSAYKRLQSLIHNQLSSPRYHSLFRYSWFKGGYVAEKLGEFENPVDFSLKTFSNTLWEISGCQNVSAIRCSRCKKSLCFKHFFEEHHYCTTYNE